MNFWHRFNQILKKAAVTVFVFVVIGSGVLLAFPEYASAYQRSKNVSATKENIEAGKKSYDRFASQANVTAEAYNQERRRQVLISGILIGLLISSPVLVIILINIFKRIHIANKKKAEASEIVMGKAFKK